MPTTVSPIEATGSPEADRLFLQPLALALVCFIFVALLITGGVMNLQTIDQTLAGYIENRGLGIITEVHRSAERLYRQLVQTPHAFFDPDTGVPLADDAFALQEALITQLVLLAQTIDSGLEAHRRAAEAAPDYGEREGLWLVTALDETGRIQYTNRPIPPEVLELATSVVGGSESFKTNLFDRSAIQGLPTVVALRRKAGTGTLILAMDDAGFRRRCAGFSVQRAVEGIAPSPDIVYLNQTSADVRGAAVSDAPSAAVQPEGAAGNPLRTPTPVGIRKVSGGRQDVLQFEATIDIDGEEAGTVRLGLATAGADRILQKNRQGIFISTACMIIIALLSMWFLYRNQNRYLSRVQALQRRVDQAERLSALGRLAAGVAHEIRNPLNAISMAVQRLQRDAPNPLTAVIRDEIQGLNRLVEDVLGLARSRKLERVPRDLTTLLSQIVMLLQEEASAARIAFSTHWPPEPLMVSIDVEKMQRAILNIVRNAMESISSGGMITLSLRSLGRQGIRITIADTGTGLSEDQRAHMFEPGFTTKAKGLGLGLPLANEIIRGHGGRIRVTSGPGQGTVVEILLPDEHRIRVCRN